MPPSGHVSSHLAWRAKWFTREEGPGAAQREAAVDWSSGLRRLRVLVVSPGGRAVLIRTSGRALERRAAGATSGAGMCASCGAGGRGGRSAEAPRGSCPAVGAIGASPAGAGLVVPWPESRLPSFPPSALETPLLRDQNAPQVRNVSRLSSVIRVKG